MWLLRFILGWTTWIIVFVICLVSNLILWNWKETFTIDMEIVITEILGKTVMNTMLFKND
jgi:hypothetical protein